MPRALLSAGLTGASFRKAELSTHHDLHTDTEPKGIGGRLLARIVSLPRSRSRKAMPRAVRMVLCSGSGVFCALNVCICVGMCMCMCAM